MSEDAVAFLVSSRLGLAPRPGWASELPRSLHGISRAHGIALAELVARLATDERMLRETAERLLVSESHFFRDRSQLETVAQRVALRLSTRSDADVRVWSAGCARGEEPYSLVLLLAELLPAVALRKVHVLGTDLHRGCIETAIRGVYTSWSLRGVSAAERRAFVTDGAMFRLRDSARSAVRFSARSLDEELASCGERAWDVVLFRNVAVYMTAEALSRTFQGLSRALRPGGLLVVATTDPRPPASMFVRADGAVPGLYEARPASGPRRQPEATTSVTVPTSRALPSLDEARALADRGRLEGARQLVEAHLAAAPSSWNAWLLHGQIAFAAGDVHEARSAFARAAEIAPEALVVVYWHALALREAGLRAEARARIETLRAGLARLDPSALLEDGATSVAELGRAAASLREDGP